MLPACVVPPLHMLLTKGNLHSSSGPSIERRKKNSIYSLCEHPLYAQCLWFQNMYVYEGNDGKGFGRELLCTLNDAVVTYKHISHHSRIRHCYLLGWLYVYLPWLLWRITMRGMPLKWYTLLYRCTLACMLKLNLRLASNLRHKAELVAHENCKFCIKHVKYIYNRRDVHVV